MLDSLMEDKRLDLNAPLLSVRRFASAPPPPRPPSSCLNAAVVNASSGAEDALRTAARQGPRRSSVSFYKSDLKSGLVQNAGVVPFLWERAPGQPKEGTGSGGAGSSANPVGGPLVASKPPPGRVPRRLSDEKKEQISLDAINNGVLPRRPPPHSSISTSTADTTTATSLHGSFSISSGSSREDATVNSKTKPTIEKAPILEEHPSGSDEGDGEEDAFSDALDTLSRAESSFMNCSISGLSDGADSPEPSGRFSTDPLLRDFMMGRFLPAARAMATTGLPQGGPGKTSVYSRTPARCVIENEGERRRPAVPLPHQHRPNYGLNHAPDHHQTKVGNTDNGDDDDDECDDPGHLPVKGCGLLPRFCMKSSFCLLNPVPGMRVRGRMPMPVARRLRPQVLASDHGSESVGNAEDEHTWEEVYKHKLGRAKQTLGEDASKLTSESNQISYWSDSQTADGSSSYRRSTAGGFSPCRNDMSHSPLHEDKGFLGVSNHETRSGEVDDLFESYIKDGEKYSEIMPHLDGKQTSGSLSPVIEKTVYVDSVEVLEDPGSKLSFSDTKGPMKDVEIVRESQRIEESLMLEACEDEASQHKVPEVVIADDLCSAGRSGALETISNMADHLLDDTHHLKAEDQGKNGVNAVQTLLPPPLPKSPSESWLLRTLPSVASNRPIPLSFLSVQFCPKKQAIQASSTDPRREIMVKKSAMLRGQMRFADVLARPASED